jgi:hypothetical protein
VARLNLNELSGLGLGFAFSLGWYNATPLVLWFVVIAGYVVIVEAI